MSGRCHDHRQQGGWYWPALALLIGLWSGCARADCIDVAAQRYQVNADVLRAIAYYESHLNPAAINHNANGTVDVGLMQINSIHLPALRRAGIDLAQLKDSAVNAEVGAALLSDAIRQYGSTWQAVAAYHSRTPGLGEPYARAVRKIWAARPWLNEAYSHSRPLSAAGSDVSVTSVQAG